MHYRWNDLRNGSLRIFCPFQRNERWNVWHKPCFKPLLTLPFHWNGIVRNDDILIVVPFHYIPLGIGLERYWWKWSAWKENENEGFWKYNNHHYLLGSEKMIISFWRFNSTVWAQWLQIASKRELYLAAFPRDAGVVMVWLSCELVREISCT